MSKKKPKMDQEEVIDYGMVLYTDGGCRPGGRGIGGWGIHGYSYPIKPTKPGKKESAATDQGYFNISLDEGSFDDEGYWSQPINDRREEFDATVISVSNYWDAWGSLLPETTNNIAELTALNKALEIIKDANPKKVRFWLDSEYVLNGITNWHEKWAANNWVTSAGKPVSNAELWQETLVNYNQLKDKVEFNFGWVRGHNGDPGNEKADNNATRGVIAGKKGLELEETISSPVANYWSRKNNVNRLLALPYWYFAVNKPTPTTEAGHTVYHIGAHGPRLTVCGKRVSDHGYGVVMLKEADPVLEIVRDFQNTDCNHSYERVVVADLAKILNPENYHDMTVHGDTYLFNATHQNDIYDVKEDRYTEELASPLLLFRATEQLSHLEGRLAAFLSGTHPYQTVDITDRFFEEGKKGKKTINVLAKSFKQSVKSLDVPFTPEGSETPITITLNVGQDLPNRNALNAIAEGHPKVTMLVEKETERSFRYWTVVQVGDDASIWSSVYANQKILLD